MADDDMYNIGGLARAQFGRGDVVLVGFGSYSGSVMAGRAWGAPMQVMDVPKARHGSWENVLHTALGGNSMLFMDDLAASPFSKEQIGHRAIGVVYRPENDRISNYVPSVIAERYDAFIFMDETKALHPVQMHADPHKTPETYPFGV
jgi:erythromycin esterase-like protein